MGHDTHGDISTSTDIDRHRQTSRHRPRFRPLGSRAWGRSQSPDCGGAVGAMGCGAMGQGCVPQGFPKDRLTSQRNPRLLMLLPAWFTHWMVAFESGVDRKVSHHLPSDTTEGFYFSASLGRIYRSRLFFIVASSISPAGWHIVLTRYLQWWKWF